MVTNLIIDRLEAGVVPWQMPWKAGSLPRNMVSKKAYRGFNFWYLLSFNFQRPYFLTFHQIKNLGGSVKKGAKSVQVIFWKLNEYEDRDSGEQKKIPMLRYYRVFNIDDTEGIPENKIPDSETHDHDFSPIEACENIVRNWQDIPKIESG